MVPAEVVIAIISIVAMFIPEASQYLEEKYYEAKGITQGKMMALLTDIISRLNVLSSTKANKLISKLQSTISAYMPSGSANYTSYLNKAKEQARAKLDKLTGASVEQEVYSNAANQLANIYESLPSRQKDSSTGKAISDRIKDNVSKAAEAAKVIDPNFDASSFMSEFETSAAAGTKPVNVQEAQKNLGINKMRMPSK